MTVQSLRATGQSELANTTESVIAVNDRREPVAQRILFTLEACAAKKRALRIQEIVHETGMAKTTVHRMCWNLVELGLLDHSAAGFSVGSKLFELGAKNPQISQLRATAIPYLVDLWQRTGAMPNLAILSGRRVLILDGIYSHDSAPKLPRLVGYALPLHCVATGKAVAAKLDEDQRESLLVPGRLPAATKSTIVNPVILRRQLEKVAETGIARAHEELLTGCVSAAAAFRIRGGGLAAIGVVDAWNSPAFRRAQGPIVEAAQALEKVLA